jgi:hypothetical protein
MPGDTEPKLAPRESFHLSNTVSGSSINSRSALGHWFEKSRLDFARREAESGETASDFMLPGGNKILLPNSEGNVFFRRARGIDFNVLERTFSQIYILRPVLSAFIAIFFLVENRSHAGPFQGVRGKFASWWGKTLRRSALWVSKRRAQFSSSQYRNSHNSPLYLIIVRFSQKLDLLLF